jgi:outer membrane protein
MKYTGNIALILSIAIGIYLMKEKMTTSSKKIGVVQMDKLVYEFKGMKEATERYTVKINKWNAESDSLKRRLQGLYEQLKLDSLNHDKTKLNKDIQVFLLFKQSYLDHAGRAEENAQKEDREMTLGVVNQVNEYIEKYAKSEGYDVILCNSDQQNVGYAKEKVDVTQEVLEFANKEYSGGK